MLEEFDARIVMEAIQRTVEKNKPWVYAKKILINWPNQKFYSIKDVLKID
jgi:DnaD/phage-associated family protein